MNFEGGALVQVVKVGLGGQGVVVVVVVAVLVSGARLVDLSLSEHRRQDALKSSALSSPQWLYLSNAN